MTGWATGFIVTVAQAKRKRQAPEAVADTKRTQFFFAFVDNVPGVFPAKKRAQFWPATLLNAQNGFHARRLQQGDATLAHPLLNHHFFPYRAIMKVENIKSIKSKGCDEWSGTQAGPLFAPAPKTYIHHPVQRLRQLHRHSHRHPHAARPQALPLLPVRRKGTPRDDLEQRYAKGENIALPRGVERRTELLVN